MVFYTIRREKVVTILTESQFQVEIDGLWLWLCDTGKSNHFPAEKFVPISFVVVVKKRKKKEKKKGLTSAKRK